MGDLLPNLKGFDLEQTGGNLAPHIEGIWRRLASLARVDSTTQDAKLIISHSIESIFSSPDCSRGGGLGGRAAGCSRVVFHLSL